MARFGVENFRHPLESDKLRGMQISMFRAEKQRVLHLRKLLIDHDIFKNITGNRYFWHGRVPTPNHLRLHAELYSFEYGRNSLSATDAHGDQSVPPTDAVQLVYRLGGNY